MKRCNGEAPLSKLDDGGKSQMVGGWPHPRHVRVENRPFFSFFFLLDLILYFILKLKTKKN